MTTYQTGTAFRRALEDRLLAQSQQTTLVHFRHPPSDRCPPRPG